WRPRLLRGCYSCSPRGLDSFSSSRYDLPPTRPLGPEEAMSNRLPFRLRPLRAVLFALAFLCSHAGAEPPPLAPPALDLSLPDTPALSAAGAAPGLTPPSGPQRAPLKFDPQSDGFWGTLTGKQVIQQGSAQVAWEDPTWKRTWQSEQAWRCPLAGPFSL